MIRFVSLRSEGQKDTLFKVPVEEGNTIRLSTVRDRFPGAIGLIDKEREADWELRMDDGRFWLPDDFHMSDDHVYEVVFNKEATEAYMQPPGRFQPMALRSVVSDLVQPTVISALQCHDAAPLPQRPELGSWPVAPKKIFTMTFPRRFLCLHKGAFDISTAKESAYKVLLRIGLRQKDPTTPIDDFVGIHTVSVNGQPITNPAVSGRLNSVIDITDKITANMCGENKVEMEMPAHLSEGYVVTVQYVQCHSLDELLYMLTQRKRPYDKALDEIVGRLYKPSPTQVADVLPAEEAKISLICPIGCKRLQYPCRGKECHHVQCFDAATYLLMATRSDKWTCPICRRNAPFDDLLIDGFLYSVVDKLSEDDSNIQSILVKPCGSWQVESDKGHEHGQSIIDLSLDEGVECLD